MKGRLRVTSALKHKETKTDDKSESEGGGRQKLKHVDGDFPYCVRRERDDNENKMSRNEDPKGKRRRLDSKFRNVEGDVPMSM